MVVFLNPWSESYHDLIKAENNPQMLSKGKESAISHVNENTCLAKLGWYEYTMSDMIICHYYFQISMYNPDAKKEHGCSPGHGSTSESTRPDSPEAQRPPKRMRQDEPGTSTGSQDTVKTYPEPSEQTEEHKQGKIFTIILSRSEQTEEHKQGKIFMTLSSRSEKTEEHKQGKIFLTLLSTSEQTEENKQGKVFMTLSSTSEQPEEHKQDKIFMTQSSRSEHRSTNNVWFSWHYQHLNRQRSTDKVRFSWLHHQHLNRGAQTR